MTPTAPATRRMVTDSTPSRSSSAPALAAMRCGVNSFMYTWYTYLVYSVHKGAMYGKYPYMARRRRSAQETGFGTVASELIVPQGLKSVRENQLFTGFSRATKAGTPYPRISVFTVWVSSAKSPLLAGPPRRQAYFEDWSTEEPQCTNSCAMRTVAISMR